MIKLKNVSKIYYQNGSIAIGFSKVSAEFNIGEFVVIVGESGSGKSTLLNVISGLDTYEEGEMYINGEETSHYGEREFEDYRRKYVANIFQSFNLVNSYTVKQNVELVLLLNGFKRKEIKTKVNDILKKVGLFELRNRRVSRLSGGQKQRVAIARALAKEVPIIVADEPTGNLDKEAAMEIFKLLSEISKEKLVIVVSHNLEQVESYATRIIKMHDGKKVEDKKIKEVEVKEVNTSVYREMSLIAKIFLSIRNAFNVLPKFVLVFAVFFVLSFALLYETYSILNDRYMQANRNSNIFNDQSPERILIKKNDGTSFNDEEYNNILNIEHVTSVNKYDSRDLIVNGEVIDSEEYPPFSGELKLLDNVDVNLVAGVLPEREYEILYVLPNNDWLLEYSKQYILNKDINMFDSNYNKGDYSHKYKVVGLAVNKDKNNYDSYIVTNEFTFKKMITSFNYLRNAKSDDRITTNFFGNMKVIASPKVSDGEVYRSSSRIIFDKECKDELCSNKLLKITVDDIYYQKELEFKHIVKTDKQLNKIFKLGEYFTYGDFLFISENDFERLFNNGIYQSSVYVDEIDNVDLVKEELENRNYYALAIKDTASDLDGITKFSMILSFMGLLIFAFVLIAISTFVINIILRSRNRYYAVVRMLGGTMKLNKSLIYLELLFIATLAYISTTVMFIINHHKSFLPFDILRFIKIPHILLIYLGTIVVTIIIATKFSRKLFKDSMITTYNMEV